MAKKKKLSVAQKFLIVGVVLIVFQVVFIFAFSRDKSQTVRDAIHKAVSDQTNLSPERREQLKIQLALADFMLSNDNQPPADLGMLVPKYFDEIPLNPRTSNPFKYQILSQRPIVGDPGVLFTTKERGSSNKKAKQQSSSYEEEELLIASLLQPAESNNYVYDPTGKRDPFRPFNFAPEDAEGEGRTPLETYTIGQLKLTAVLKGFAEPTAFVEDGAGKGYPVIKGTKIGPNDGEVVDILPDRILILETSVDFTGASKTRTIEMKLRTKDQEKRR